MPGIGARENPERERVRQRDREAVRQREKCLSSWICILKRGMLLDVQYKNKCINCIIIRRWSVQRRKINKEGAQGRLRS